MSISSRVDKYIIYIMENYTAITMNELQLHVRTWMNLTKIMLSKKQKTYKVTQSTIPSV